MNKARAGGKRETRKWRDEVRKWGKDGKGRREGEQMYLEIRKGVGKKERGGEKGEALEGEMRRRPRI
jgi:hypothetical protein